MIEKESGMLLYSILSACAGVCQRVRVTLGGTI